MGVPKLPPQLGASSAASLKSAVSARVAASNAPWGKATEPPFGPGELANDFPMAAMAPRDLGKILDMSPSCSICPIVPSQRTCKSMNRLGEASPVPSVGKMYRSWCAAIWISTPRKLLPFLCFSIKKITTTRFPEFKTPMINYDVPSRETKSSHLKMVVSNRNLLFQRSIFRGEELLVSGRVSLLSPDTSLKVMLFPPLPPPSSGKRSANIRVISPALEPTCKTAVIRAPKRMCPKDFNCTKNFPNEISTGMTLLQWIDFLPDTKSPASNTKDPGFRAAKYCDICWKAMAIRTPSPWPTLRIWEKSRKTPSNPKESQKLKVASVHISSCLKSFEGFFLEVSTPCTHVWK